MIYIQWSVTVSVISSASVGHDIHTVVSNCVISSASVGHGTHKLASRPFVMMYMNALVGQN